MTPTDQTEENLVLTPIQPGGKSKPKAAAAPPKASIEEETIEDFATFGTSPEQVQMMEIRANDRHKIKSAARKQHLVKKDSELLRKDAEIQRLNEELAKTEATSKQKVEMFKNQVEKQTKLAKEMEAEKDAKIASLLMKPVVGSEDLTRALEEENKVKTKLQEDLAAKDKEIFELNTKSLKFGPEVVKQLQADNLQLKLEKEQKDQDLREKTAIIQDMATQGEEETHQ